MRAPISGLMTIAAVAAEFELSYRTLRFYEDRGLIKPLRLGQDRLYSAGDRIRIQLILKGKRLGFSLSEIGKLISSHETPESPDRSAPDLMLDVGTVRQQIATLERRRDELILSIAELKAGLSVVMSLDHDNPALEIPGATEKRRGVAG